MSPSVGHRRKETPVVTNLVTAPLIAAVDNPPWAEIDRLRRTSPMCDAVVDEIEGRRIRIGEQWLTDFASCNYLGFDLDPEIIDAVEPQLRRWGTHPSWSRLIGNPRPYLEIEERLTDLLGAPDTLALPTITHIHTAMIPVLVGDGTVLMDAQAHRTIYDGCMIARGRGATLRRFRADDVDDLERHLRKADPTKPRVVCMDGINSMTGNAPDLRAFAQVCRELDAVLYVDDAHGSKAYSSLLAFMALPTDVKNMLKVAAPPYAYSGPAPTASLATVLAGFEVNASRGDQIRRDLYDKTARVLSTVRELGLSTPNVSGFPIIEITLVGVDVDLVGEFLFSHGVYATLATFPVVPRNQVGFRLQITAANTDEEIDHLRHVLAELAERFVAGPAD
jgi:8-amino-7-oxononanoate synthase